MVVLQEVKKANEAKPSAICLAEIFMCKKFDELGTIVNFALTPGEAQEYRLER